MKHLLVIPFLLLFCSCRQNEFLVSSPDTSLQVGVSITNDGMLRYKVRLDETTMIEDSPLGIDLGRISFTEALRFKKWQISDIKTDSFTMLTGKSKHICERYREAVVALGNAQNQEMLLLVRVYDGGVAFRYKFDKKDTVLYTVKKELSGFHIPTGKAWLAPYDVPGDYKPAYETYYENELNSDAQSPKKEGWAFPCLFQIKDKWLLLTESDVHETYCSSHLNSPWDGIFTIRFPEEKEARGLFSSQPEIMFPWESPWRVIITGRNPGGIFQSNLVHALAKASTLKDTEWIQPGLASWSWWSDNDSPEDYQKLRDFVDFGARMGWKHSLIDAKWDQMSGGDIGQLAAYASSKGVDLWVWYNSAGVHNQYDLGPRDILYDSLSRVKEFDRISGIGIKGIKVDYIESDKQAIVKLYTDILKDAAKYKLMVNFHGCKLPTGWSRTYPHLLTMEAVRGAECYKLDKTYPERAAVCNSILPFTRNVVGPMDYTPTTFTRHKYPHKTTFAHELALSVLFESGIQHLADDLRMYEKQPDYVIDFLKKLPAVWDNSLLLDGYPGSFVVVARKDGDKWFFAGINSKNSPRDYILSFPFLSGEKAQLYLITDGNQSDSFKNIVLQVNDKSKVPVRMLPEGGFCGYVQQ